MVKFFTHIIPFWNEQLKNHIYSRKVPFEARNFDHLDRNFYNKDYLLQSFNEEVPDTAKFRNILGIDKGSVSWTCVLPNVILPTHKDTFYTMRQEYTVEIDQCYRYLLFLEEIGRAHV